MVTWPDFGKWVKSRTFSLLLVFINKIILLRCSYNLSHYCCFFLSKKKKTSKIGRRNLKFRIEIRIIYSFACSNSIVPKLFSMDCIFRMKICSHLNKFYVIKSTLKNERERETKGGNCRFEVRLSTLSFNLWSLVTIFLILEIMQKYHNDIIGQ